MSDGVSSPNPGNASEQTNMSAPPNEAEGASVVSSAENEQVKSSEQKQSVFQELSPTQKKATPHNDIDFVLDIPVQLTVELGRTKLAIKNLLQIAPDAVIELDGLAGEPLDVLANGCLIAKGEVVVVNEKMGLRLTDIVAPAERASKLHQ